MKRFGSCNDQQDTIHDYIGSHYLLTATSGVAPIGTAASNITRPTLDHAPTGSRLTPRLARAYADCIITPSRPKHKWVQPERGLGVGF